jgi:sodium/potassium-transporting ATPase subunit alpha
MDQPTSKQLRQSLLKSTSSVSLRPPSSEDKDAHDQPMLSESKNHLDVTTPLHSPHNTLYNVLTESATNTSTFSIHERPNRMSTLKKLHTAPNSASRHNVVHEDNVRLSSIRVFQNVTSDDHFLTLSQIDQRYNSKLNLVDVTLSGGLDVDFAKKRLQKHGPNSLVNKTSLNYCDVLISEFKEPLSIWLLFAFVLSLIPLGRNQEMEKNVTLSLAIIFVLIVNALIIVEQKRKSYSILDSFRDLVPCSVLCVRSGRKHKIKSYNLVVGDVIFLTEGDRIPADLRIIWTNGIFKIDISSLTGENEPQVREAAPCLDPETTPMNANNLAFSGTLVISGEAVAIVIRTGESTMLGKIAGLASKDRIPSPLVREISIFVKVISLLSISTASILFIVAFSISRSFTTSFNSLIGVFMANIPQGLPATVSLLLTFGVQRLSKKSMLVKDLDAVDTMGSITVLACDKTGTITQNRMRLVEVWINGNSFHDSVSSSGRRQSIISDFNPDMEGAELLFDVCCYCTRARFDPDADNLLLPHHERKVIGDSTEASLLRFASQFRDWIAFQGVDQKIAFQIPFNSFNKWSMTVLRRVHSSGFYVALLKGAPEKIVSKCSFVFDKGNIREKTYSDTRKIENTYERMASRGQRVIGFAFQMLPGHVYHEDYKFELSPPNYPEKFFVFLGLAGLMDPPKEGVDSTIQLCRDANIRIIMMTGDHQFTAESVARQIGLIQGETVEQAAERLRMPLEEVPDDEYDALVIPTERIDELTEEEWSAVLNKKEIVFSRTTPIQKLEIVKRFQQVGHIVAVTGDGVNDVPALRKADLGIAMGIAGSDIAKEVSQVILLDDNFCGIIDGIIEGRLIFDNLKKAVRYVMTHIGPEVWPFVFFVVFGIPSAISPVLLLFVDLGSDIPPALSLAWEPAEKDISTNKPRKLMRDSPKDLNLLQRLKFMSLQYLDHFRWRFSSEYETLVDSRLLLWSYLQAGFIEAGSCFFAFFLVFSESGIPARALLGSSWSGGMFESQTSYTTPSGITYDFEDLSVILVQAQSAYFMTIIIVQIFVLMACKSQNEYFFSRQHAANYRPWLSVPISLGIGFIAVYSPDLNSILGSSPFPGLAYIPAIVGGILILVLDTAKKYYKKTRERRKREKRDRAKGLSPHQSAVLKLYKHRDT